MGAVTSFRKVTVPIFVLVLGISLPAQRGGRFPEPDRNEDPFPVRNAEYHFIRLEYTDLPQFHRRWGYSSRSGQGAGWWNVDWPEADNHFTRGVEWLTRVDTGDPRHLRLTDDTLSIIRGSMRRRPAGGI